MEASLKMVGRFYPRFIFNTWPRLKKEGFRWGPRSLLGIPKDFGFLDVEGEAAVLTEDRGLLVKFSGIMLGRPVRFQDLTRLTYHLPKRSSAAVQFKLEILPDQNLLADPDDSLDAGGNNHFAVVLSLVVAEGHYNTAN
jgi:hypothetical protein